MLRKEQTRVHAFLVYIKRGEVLSAYIHTPPSHTPSNIGSKKLDFMCFDGMRPHTSQRWGCTYTQSYPVSVQRVWGARELWVSVGVC